MNNESKSAPIFLFIIGGVVVVCVVMIGLGIVLMRGDQGTVVPSTSIPESTTSTTTPSPDTSQPPIPGDPVDVTVNDHVVMMGLLERQYLAISPIDPGDEPLPVVMVLHGMGVNRADMSHAGNWRQAVSDRNFIAVFPEGSLGSWNAGPCCPPASLVGADDQTFLDRVYDDMQRQFAVDTDRVFLTGFSNGGVMTYSYACARTGLFRAIAPMAGSNLSGCAADVPLPILHIHGNPDPVVPFDGSIALTQILSSEPFPVVTDTLATWARSNGCTADMATQSIAENVQLHDWSNCDNDAAVELVEVAGAEHNWPDSPGFVALDYLLDFFQL